MKLETILEETRAAVAPHIGSGRIANYIPALARIDPNKFGIAVVQTDGATTTLGDAQEPFSIQSISKVFTLTMALGLLGDELWQRVGREPSGSPFNSIVQLEHENGIPRNPFINAGAIVVSDIVLAGRQPSEAIAEIIGFMRTVADDPSIAVDDEVALSESEVGYRNKSLANFMKGFGNLDHNVEDVLQVYFHQCALSLSCVQLARAALFLADRGHDPLTGRSVVKPERARRIKALMLTCGHYDASGDFAFRVGLPGKSGVGGGILAIVPGVCAIAAWSPGLNANGNSLVGTLALEQLATRTGWSVFV
ncbi:MAG: glutaminase [Pseudomonadota bacterium]